MPPLHNTPLTSPADPLQRLMGASLLVFKNKNDVSGCMNVDDIREVRDGLSPTTPRHTARKRSTFTYVSTPGITARQHQNAQVAYLAVFRY